MGSVATKLVQLSTVPVLLFRPTRKGLGMHPDRLSAVIVPLDGSALGEGALPHARGLAKAMELDVVLTSVAPTPRTLPGVDLPGV